MLNTGFKTQAALVIRCIPAVAQHDCFALKGGTAINLFVRDLPRFSVDIDLAYLPVRARNESLQEISDQLQQLKGDIERAIPGSKVSEKRIDKYVCKLVVGTDDAEIKIEPNLVLRGSLEQPEVRELSPAAQKMFSASARVLTLADADLYAGKLCAALDRQHPRDLFDVRLLLIEGGITRSIRRAFVVYLASHPRPMHELLKPNLLDIAETFERQFIGMTSSPVSMDELLKTRGQLIQQLVPSLDSEERHFLLSLSSGSPDWNVLGIEGLEQLPALRWKLTNIRKMDRSKRMDQLKLLQDILAMP